MPLYEYQCEQCGEAFEVRQKFSDEPLTVHEKCNGKAHRLISVPALQFKGSGFYITDYAKGSAAGPKSEGASKAGSKSDGNGTSGGGESKSSSSDTKSSSDSKPSTASSSSDKKSG